jgi:hypothetical protein
MTMGLAAMLLGLFAVPAALLWAGHRLRQRSRAVRLAFWGALAGHTLAILPTVLAGLLPPAWWSDGDRWRGFFGFGSMLAAAVVGAGLALLVGAARRPRSTARRP